MPRYFFDLHDDMEVLDPDGVDLPHIFAANEHALLEAREVLRESIAEGKIDLRHHIKIRDEAGKTISVVPFGDAVQVIQEGLPRQDPV
jgi:hypothetical protein